MATFHFLLILSLLASSPLLCISHSHLSLNYYSQSCPQFDQIMQQTTTDKQIRNPTTSGATLRLFFHDCFVSGCDASTLITSRPPFSSAERDADINLSLPGDGFDVVVRAKAALDIACPAVVSCADILAVATRNLVSFVGGPFYTVLLGRKDSLTSLSSAVDGQLPLPSMPIDSIASIFAQKNFSLQEMVALSGAHTIGFSHCKEFADGIYNYSGSGYDPTYSPRLAVGLDEACKEYQRNPSVSVFNDIMTPNKFDNMYFQNLPKGLGILKSDRALYSDPRTRAFVELYGRDQNAFFRDFGKAMQKLSVVGVKVGDEGEVRRRCDAFNRVN